MDIGVRHTGIPLGSLIKLIFVGHGITSVIIAVVYSAVEFVVTSSKLASLSLSELVIYAIVGVLMIVLHVLGVALATSFGLWIYGRWADIDVYFVD